jgi:hypothetical protein
VQFPIQLDRSTALELCFNAFSSGEPVPTSLENALAIHRSAERDRSIGISGRESAFCFLGRFGRRAGRAQKARDGVKETTRIDRSQIHKFTIYMNSSYG